MGGITLNLAKSELQHFSRKQADHDPLSAPSISHRDIRISEDPNKPYTRWLEVQVDRTLSFKWHVSILAKKALKVANALCSLSNPVRGAPPPTYTSSYLSLHTSHRLLWRRDLVAWPHQIQQ